jgi:UDP-glucose 4-epimerase
VGVLVAGPLDRRLDIDIVMAELALRSAEPGARLDSHVAQDIATGGQVFDDARRRHPAQRAVRIAVVPDVMAGVANRRDLVGVGAGPGADDEERGLDVAVGQDGELRLKRAERVLSRLVWELGIDRDRQGRHGRTIARNLSRAMDCLVTGGAGFIGSHVVDALLRRGDTVTVLDDLSTGRRENLRGALERGALLHAVDVRDAAAVAGVFATARPEVVFHLAARVDVTHSVAHPVEDLMTNVVGTINVLEAARAAGTQRLVNSSTGGGLYGEAEVLPTPEDHPVRPLAPYGQAKYAAEGYCELYSRLHGLSIVSLRYGNVYGPRQDLRGEAGVVAIFFGRLLEGRRPMIFGDGRQTRDWVEVSDVVNANLAAAASEVRAPVNIARGRETSLLELLGLLGDLAASEALSEPEFAPARAGEVRRSCLDASRAWSELAWKAEIDVREGLRRMLASLREHTAS